MKDRTMNHPMTRLSLTIAAALSAVALTAGTAHAVTFKVADQGDALSMDPHSLNESLQLSVLGNIYEPLVLRDRKLNLMPGASSCARTSSSTTARRSTPTTWCSRWRAPRQPART